jgi:predicted phosphate transport protein (TIGR00153 family)
MDGIPNAAKDISGVMIGRKMVIPEHMSKRFIDCTNSAITATHQACDAIKKVNEMQRSGFGGKNSNQLHHLVAEIEQLEQENDELEISLRNELFKIEQDLPPVDVIFLYDIINKIGILADISQTLGHILIRLVAK